MKKILLLVLVFSNAVFPNDSFEATGDKSSDFIFKEDDINGSGGGLFFQYAIILVMK